jgi:hypothetical protein
VQTYGKYANFGKRRQDDPAKAEAVFAVRRPGYNPIFSLGIVSFLRQLLLFAI